MIDEWTAAGDRTHTLELSTVRFVCFLGPSCSSPLVQLDVLAIILVNAVKVCMHLQICHSINFER